MVKTRQQTIYSKSNKRVRAIYRESSESSESEGENESYEFQKIVSSGYLYDEKYYLIKWKGYSSKYNSWEPLKHLEGIKSQILMFELNQKRKFQKKYCISRKLVPAAPVIEDSSEIYQEEESSQSDFIEEDSQMIYKEEKLRVKHAIEEICRQQERQYKQAEQLQQFVNHLQDGHQSHQSEQFESMIVPRDDIQGSVQYEMEDVNNVNNKQIIEDEANRFVKSQGTWLLNSKVVGVLAANRLLNQQNDGSILCQINNFISILQKTASILNLNSNQSSLTTISHNLIQLQFLFQYPTFTIANIYQLPTFIAAQLLFRQRNGSQRKYARLQMLSFYFPHQVHRFLSKRVLLELSKYV